MLSRKNIVRLSVVFGILCWITLLIVDLIIIFSRINDTRSGIPEMLPQLLLISLFIFSYVFFKNSIKDTESIDILDLLWRVFVTGLATTLISLLLRAFMYRFSDSPLVENPLVIGAIYHANIGLVIIFLVSMYVVWQKLTLYQKSKNLIRFWSLFQYSLLVSFFFILFKYNFFDPFFSSVFIILMIMALVLSANLKWVAYLDFKQKWKSILLIVLSILCLWYFFDHLSNFDTITPEINLVYNVSALALFAFILIYSVFSLLVLLFNLPTSSVFEQKLEEVLNFQRLSQSPQTGQNEDQVYDILLESSVSAVLANAAWLEILSENKVEKKLLTYRLARSKVKDLKEEISMGPVKAFSPKDAAIGLKMSRRLKRLKDPDYRSALLFPIIIQGKQIGSLCLLKDVNDGFNREMVEIIKTFVNQACISIENHRLLSEALINERYKEELKIAKKVQKSLIPQRLGEYEHFNISAFTHAADEVGGDYYDAYRLSDDRIALIIGDVSGKGTSAAFHMSQMKGVFHSLVQLNLSPKEFIVHANSALSRCLEKSSFITVSFFIIDKKEHTVEFARAGHCPTLYYDTAKQQAIFFKTKGLGLGILRNDNFSKYVEVEKVSYKPGDIIFLYTDGITEAKNLSNEQYGYDKLAKFVKENAAKSPSSLQADLIRDLYEFCEKQQPEDDFTTMIVKFI